MICKQTQNTISTLLRLKDSPAINKIIFIDEKSQTGPARITRLYALV